MKSLTEHLWFEVPGRRGFISVKEQAPTEFFVPNRGVAPKELYALFINDDESGLHHDYEVWLEKLAPHAPRSR